MEFTNRVSSPFPRTAWAVCTRHLGRNTVKTVLLSYTQCSYCLGSGAPGHTDRRSQAVACAQLNAQRGQTRGTNRGQSLSSCLCVHSCSLPPPAWLADWALGPCWFYPPPPFFQMHARLQPFRLTCNTASCRQPELSSSNSTAEQRPWGSVVSPSSSVGREG